MTNEEKKRIADLVADRICDYYSYEGCEYKHIFRALDKIDRVGAYKNFFERNLKYKDEIGLDGSKLASKDINDSINYLLELKNEGWVGIDEYSDYGHGSYFSVYRFIEEPDDVYMARICKLIGEYVNEIFRENDRIKEKEKELEKVKKELDDLMKEIYRD